MDLSGTVARALDDRRLAARPDLRRAVGSGAVTGAHTFTGTLAGPPDHVGAALDPSPCCLVNGGLGGRHPGRSSSSVFCVRTGTRSTTLASASTLRRGFSPSLETCTRGQPSSTSKRSCTIFAGPDGQNAWVASGRAGIARSQGKLSPGTERQRARSPSSGEPPSAAHSRFLTTRPHESCSVSGSA